MHKGRCTTAVRPIGQRSPSPLERTRGAWEVWTPEEVSREVAPMAGGVYDVPSESFAATELGIRERVTRRELSDADDGEERATLHLPRHGLEELCRERTAERDDVRARLRTAIGLLNDLDAVGVRASLFLNEEIGKQ